MELLTTLGPLDYGFLIILGLSMLLGMASGFVQVAMSLAGWFVGLTVAHFLAEFLAPYLQSTGLGETPRYALAFILIFVIALIVWSIMTALLKQAVSKAGMGGLDRVLGAAAGLVRGIVILVTATVLISLSPADQSTTWQASTAVKMAKSAALSIKPALPPTIAAFIH